MDDSQANNGNTQGEHARRDQIPRRADSVDSRSSRHGSAHPCMSGATWDPVNSHCPIRRGPVSIMVRTYASKDELQ